MLNVKVGYRAPDFTLLSSVGKNFNLSQFFGKHNVVLYFYPMNESPVCTRQERAFRDNYEVSKELGAEIVGVSSQDSESHKAFASHHNLPFILLGDKDNEVRKLLAYPPR